MDEGTSLRKSAILVLTVQTLFGADTLDRLHKLMQQTDRTMESMRKVMTQAMNHSAAGSTYKSPFLFTAIPKKWYSRLNSRVYAGMLQKIADECVELFNSGIVIFGQKYYMVCLGLKADQPAQAKAGNFTRSFANLGQNKGCCFECLAGLNAYPFEEVSAQPAWLATLHAQVPWNQASPLVQIPHKPFQSETFFLKDPFHIFKQTMGGHFVASCLILMVDLQFYFEATNNSVENILDRLYADFNFWVKHEWRGLVRPNIKRFTRQILHFPNNYSFPFGRFKGSDTMLLVRWLKHLMNNGCVFENDITRPGVPLFGRGQPHSELMHLVSDACSGVLVFFHLLHSSGLWLDPNTSSRMAQGCFTFCSDYAKLAASTFRLQLCRFHLEPSLHHFLHFYFELRFASGPILNPAAHSCEADEDFIGKVARLSRCVHPSSVTLRVIQRMLIKYWFEYEGCEGNWKRMQLQSKLRVADWGPTKVSTLSRLQIQLGCVAGPWVNIPLKINGIDTTGGWCHFMLMIIIPIFWWSFRTCYNVSFCWWFSIMTVIITSDHYHVRYH